MKLLRIVFIIVSASVLIPYSAGARQTLQKPLENVLTLELQFGDKDVPSEYLLARPNQIAVNDAGDVYVFDEYKVKVYDKNGKPKTIFGGQGQGPGDFAGSSPYTFFIAPTGWLTVSERQTYNLYSPANKFIEKHRYSSDPIFQSLKNDYKVNFEYIGSNNNIFALDDKNFAIIGTTATSENYNEKGEYYDYIFFIQSGKLSVITKSQNINYFSISSGGSVSVNILGRLFGAVLPGSKILYTHTLFDEKIMNDIAQLTFHIVSPENNVKREFSVTYRLEAIPDSVIQQSDPSYREMSEARKEMYSKLNNTLKKRKYMPLFMWMLSDGAYIFLANETREKGKLANVVKVVNSETGKEVYNFITTESLSYRHNIIKNGYQYMLTTPKDGYPVVQKYRIDPRVYGK
jgi:hypothetical protein